ncbi:polysaccharide deacetylase family protein [Flavihumibacter solisilvae]|uniref:polysaccharide deacetylase family protein n=1 Tax=Flavihumibacter solisilvae TaxID=1349421 RepID=UPI00068E63A0|nr:polysaccharide deacetylase family protein [Flavihumibacter solisilvae]
MLTFRNTSFIFLAILFVVLLADLPWYIAALVIFVYSLMLYLGSYRVNSQFFLPAVCSGDGKKKQIAISFDDGPVSPQTPELLDLLKSKQTPAAFFCIGNRIRGKEALIKRIHEEGHIIGNHTYSHSAWIDLSMTSAWKHELAATASEVQRVIGLRPRLFRPPYGVTTPNLAGAVKQEGLVTVGWNVRSLDTVIKEDGKLYDRVMRSLQPGSIILFHDTAHATLRILPSVIDDARKQGYEIVRLDTLINEQPYA